jgi:hypothetical protein
VIGTGVREDFRTPHLSLSWEINHELTTSNFDPNWNSPDEWSGCDQYISNLVQSASGPTVTVSLGLVPFGVIAALVGLAVAWPLGLAAHRVIPSLASSDDERGMQVIITTGVLTSMMQIILFMFVL